MRRVISISEKSSIAKNFLPRTAMKHNVMLFEFARESATIMGAKRHVLLITD
jgi:hypothetical protein